MKFLRQSSNGTTATFELRTWGDSPLAVALESKIQGYVSLIFSNEELVELVDFLNKNVTIVDGKRHAVVKA